MYECVSVSFYIRFISLKVLLIEQNNYIRISDNKQITKHSSVTV